jgi:serine/threonine protein phosphatase PrpC
MRCRQAGGYVAEGRVNGSLNLSRALGDMEYKQSSALGPEAQIVTAVPEVLPQPFSLARPIIGQSCVSLSRAPTGAVCA